ncbi:MAG: hypothetical protein COZ49_02480 [Candidatus Yonathbacteria bacterium CG_4_10_14_3_um_filter_47_65]|uniref:Uncharacterized protein n=2 Tax=Parcubacteria group TaxID=1794811 RepID=A0A2M8D695_9BACT|nr:MAG: hypothetical protein AUJ44_01745 [Candidatus Nomurabacteria bacterium CG1_02_47_685]PIP03574.1 MAG: hypothetical protein COX54_03005 [Candidatus Yonathbacteria bacterium CG23_combo_of_CG06-09_8_20_14_all_46_18]PIQ31395.1 MAG: hypothetical protein COW61_03740 [Candidatus Yonathbacteria bacterium CG17_big_fil_post_rev_8_21_14_2_50_46_19]PIX56352.1 MAG: hypothetical protein COZ49_02480 [Candidatus Yonathbacteria bacterium CG_4_10_14_3_um_filter_47_65]PIY57500.1 MAG: hypothetical protein CO
MEIEGAPNEADIVKARLQARNKIQIELAQRHANGRPLNEALLEFATAGKAKLFGDIIAAHPEMLDHYLIDPEGTLDEVEGELYH